MWIHVDENNENNELELRSLGKKAKEARNYNKDMVFLRLEWKMERWIEKRWGCLPSKACCTLLFKFCLFWDAEEGAPPEEGGFEARLITVLFEERGLGLIQVPKCRPAGGCAGMRGSRRRMRL